MMQAEASRRIFNASSEADKSLQADFGFRADRGTRSAGALTLPISAIDQMLFMPSKCDDLTNKQLFHAYKNLRYPFVILNIADY